MSRGKCLEKVREKAGEEQQMNFRPCIDIHNGKVKQIVGGSLMDKGDRAQENFVAEKDADYFAKLYEREGLTGGHIILLNKSNSPYFKETKDQALKALQAYPGGLQIGGGIGKENALEYLEQGASHVIVTSAIFQDGQLSWEALRELSQATGKERLVLDLSCRKRDGQYYIVTDRWQTFTREVVSLDLLHRLSLYCDEFLIHGVDVEGKGSGMEEELVRLLGKWKECPITYAGGVSSFSDLERLYDLSEGRLDVTIGSALDLFGGDLAYQDVLEFVRGKTERSVL